MDDKLQVNARPKLVDRLRKQSKAKVDSLKDFQDLNSFSIHQIDHSGDSLFLKNCPNKIRYSNIETLSTTDKLTKMPTYGGNTMCVKPEVGLKQCKSSGMLNHPLLAEV